MSAYARGDHSTLWVALADLLFAVLAVVIVAVAPKANSDGVRLTAQKIITAEWPVDEFDADVDLWVIPPSRKPVFFGSRQDTTVTLDQDNRGWIDSATVLPDGTPSILDRAKEMTSLRGLQPGHYDVGVNLYSWHPHGKQDIDHAPVPVHIEIVDLNPSTHVLFQKDVRFQIDSETINVVSFDLDTDGRVTFVDPPLEPVTNARNNR